MGYAVIPWLLDKERIARLVTAAQPKATDRVLDVACGPGHITEAFSHVCREVIGVDLTEAPLAIARQRCQERAIANVSFQVCDVQGLPFDEATFDIAVCRLEMHHFQDPLKVLRGMTRVCRTGGNVVVEEVMTSEHGERAADHHRCETLRGSAHARYIPLSQLLILFRDAGLRYIRWSPGKLLRRWTAGCPKRLRRVPAELRRLLEEDRVRDLTGLQPYRDEQGHRFFHEHLMVVAGRKL